MLECTVVTRKVSITSNQDGSSGHMMSGNHDFIHLSLPSPSHIRTHNDLSLNCELSPENMYNLGKDILCITSHWSEWPSSKSLQTRSAGEGVEKREPSSPIGGDINWYSCYGEQWKKKKVSCSVMSDSLRPHGLQPTKPARLLHPWDFPGKNTVVGCHFLFQGIFLTQGLNLGLQYFRETLYHLSYQGSHYGEQ